MVIAEQTWEWLELQRRTGKAPVYGYKFTYTSGYLPVAAHATDVSFVFGTLPPGGSGDVVSDDGVHDQLCSDGGSKRAGVAAVAEL